MPAVIMIFSGQGAQWPAMGRALMLTDSNFRNDMLRMAQVLKRLSHPPYWTLTGKQSAKCHNR
jgi:hypothetical protein